MGNAESCSYRALRLGALAATVILVATAATGHHSAAAYDPSHCLTAHGTVASFAFMSPHSRLQLQVAMPAGGRSVLSLEATAAPALRAYDPRWSPGLLKKGMVVTAEFNPRRDGRPGGLLQDLTLPDGTVINAWRPATCPDALNYAAAHR